MAVRWRSHGHWHWAWFGLVRFGSVVGGWTLGLVAAYASGSDAYKNARGNVNANVLGYKAENPYYKLKDEHIRASIGQKEDKKGTKFDAMTDQAGWNSGYSSKNTEYVVILGYHQPDAAARCAGSRPTPRRHARTRTAVWL